MEDLDGISKLRTDGFSNHAKKFQYCSLFCEENVYKMAQLFREIDVNISPCLNSSLPSLPSLSSFSERFYVVFISSKCKQTPIWHQRACTGTHPVLWDYHVVLLMRSVRPSVIEELLSSDDDRNDRTRLHGVYGVTGDLESGSIGGKAEDAEKMEKKEEMQGEIKRERKHTSPVKECESSYIFDLDSDLSFPCEFTEYYNLSMRPEIALRPQNEQRFRVIPAADFIRYFASDRSHMEESGAKYPDWPCICGVNAGSKMNLQTYISMERKKAGMKGEDCSRDDDSCFGRIMTRDEFQVWAVSAVEDTDDTPALG